VNASRDREHVGALRGAHQSEKIKPVGGSRWVGNNHLPPHKCPSVRDGVRSVLRACMSQGCTAQHKAFGVCVRVEDFKGAYRHILHVCRGCTFDTTQGILLVHKC
jgi:hypothetical protein